MKSQLRPLSFPSSLSRQREPRLILFPILVVLLALAVVAIGVVRSPTALAAGDEWRPLDPSDLAQKTPLVDPDADAEAIFWDIRVDDGGENDLVLSHYIRIKIFTERGREKQSKIDIPFINGTKIKDVAARTIKPDGTIIELAKEDVIEKTVVKVSGLKLRTKSFAFPAIEPGAIIEYKWREVISGASANNLRLHFQREIPIQSVIYHIKPSNSLSSFNVLPFNMARPEFEKDKNGFHTTTVTKMPAFREEPLMPPEDNVKSWAIVEYYSLFRALLGYKATAAQVYIGYSPNQREENLKEAVKNRLSSAELTKIAIENVTDPAKPFIYKYHVRVPGYAQRTGKRLFLQPAFFQKGLGALFASSTRKYPIYFHYGSSEDDKVTIKLPPGYAPDNPDSPAPINAGNICHYTVKMGVAKDASMLIYNRSFFFGGENVPLFPADGYPQLKQLFDAINKADNHTIAFKQNTPAN